MSWRGKSFWEMDPLTVTAQKKVLVLRRFPEKKPLLMILAG